ncbi:hypothetical protein GCM10007879_09630 [Maritalea porphyrae]|uniref:Uncharacterized protein n=1 Tax=Maritalea porphyrae TaxID=880732 RepID=A0ABQ5UNB1_9HYPH|nr:hypothetical protein GCM10007879_09630 [Maritalea porphyrae]
MHGQRFSLERPKRICHYFHKCTDTHLPEATPVGRVTLGDCFMQLTFWTTSKRGLTPVLVDHTELNTTIMASPW